jgi:hypothetical protein
VRSTAKRSFGQFNYLGVSDVNFLVEVGVVRKFREKYRFDCIDSLEASF